MRAWASLCCLAGLSIACAPERDEPLVVLIAVDGATPRTIHELRARGKLPVLDELIRNGVWGPMESLAARRRLSARPRRGYWSPIVWASMATGKVPDKHGIVDFLLPVPGTAFAWIGNENGPPRGTLGFGEVSGTPPFELHVKLRSFPRDGPQTVTFVLNGETIGAVNVDTAWTNETLPVPGTALRTARNELTLEFERQGRPSDNGTSNDDRMLAGALGALSFTDAGGETVLTFDPVYQRFDLIDGFLRPEAKVVEAASTHMRAEPVWSLLGERGHDVGVVGYWNTWPAYEVNGFLVSSHLGVRGRREGTDQKLTWPPELWESVTSLEPDERTMAELTAELYPSDCVPLDPEKTDAFRRILWQDAYYFHIAREMLPAMERGFFTVYLESVDGAGHLFLPLKDGRELPKGCPESVRNVVDGTYAMVDRFIGELIESLPDDAIVLVASDHGIAPGGERGLHAPFGIFIASGPGFRRGHETRGASVLDVAPTILYTLGEAIPLDMDGKLLVSSFDAAWLHANPPRYADVDTSHAPTAAPPSEALSEEMRERLRSLGYVQ